MNEKIILVAFTGTATRADRKYYQGKVGSLIWLMVSTRRDISFVTIKLARFASNPGPQHDIAIKRVFRYLAGTKSLCILYKKGHQGELHGYSDVDWTGPHSEAALSISGYFFYLTGGAISWASKKQTYAWALGLVSNLAF